MFAHGFSESVPGDDGLCKWTLDGLFDVEAFRIVLLIIHGQTQDVPKRISLRLLSEISAVVDDLKCRDALWFFAKTWLRDRRLRLPKDVSRELFDWIFVASVFDESSIFSTTTCIAIRKTTGPVEDYDLPIIPRVIGT